MSNTTAFAASISSHGAFVRAAALLTITSLVLTSCSASSLPLPVDVSRPGPAAGAEAGAGCPTPTPLDDLGLEKNSGSAGQSTQDPATLDEAATGDPDTIPSLAAREALLDRVNQGPTRENARTPVEVATPDPGLGLQGDTAVPGATQPLSDSADLATDHATPTPCP